jgi:hypothetical protein
MAARLPLCQAIWHWKKDEVRGICGLERKGGLFIWGYIDMCLYLLNLNFNI